MEERAEWCVSWMLLYSFFSLVQEKIPVSTVSSGLPEASLQVGNVLFASLGLCMHDHVGDVRPLTPDSLLDLARARVRLVEPARPFERERQERHKTVVGAQKAQLARGLAGLLLDDAGNDRR